MLRNRRLPELFYNSLCNLCFTDTANTVQKDRGGLCEIFYGRGYQRSSADEVFCHAIRRCAKKGRIFERCGLPGAFLLREIFRKCRSNLFFGESHRMLRKIQHQFQTVIQMPSGSRIVSGVAVLPAAEVNRKDIKKESDQRISGVNSIGLIKAAARALTRVKQM